MQSERNHTFHVPVMGTAFSVDTPVKVARYGISSVISIGDDELLEYMRRYYCQVMGEEFAPIQRWEEDYRARRITAYLNLVDRIVSDRVAELQKSPFEPESQITRYYRLLSDHSPLKQKYFRFMETADAQEKAKLEKELREGARPGSIDVNIMTKIDRNLYGKDGKPLPDEFSDALSGLRGYARSTLQSSIVFSAGFNRRLYGYIEKFDDFFPDENGHVKKKIILKVSDYRSSATQGKFLAKKGLWVSEHRIESGLNCGGHVFATEGELLGPILEELKNRKAELLEQLFIIANDVLRQKGRPTYPQIPYTRITVQGGIGTQKEQQFLLDYFKVDGTGWATPFLLVPEVTNVDPETRQLLAKARAEDLYISEVSPLGVPFNTIRHTASERQKLERIAAGKPGSPCPKGHLVSNTEFTKKPICRASSAYQSLKIEELEALDLSPHEFEEEVEKVVRKVCLCEDLASPALMNKNLENGRPLKAAICPGPNLAYFSKISTLEEMVDHIYGRTNLLNNTYRPNMFIKELGIYLDYILREIREAGGTPSAVQKQHIVNYAQNVYGGIRYYETTMIPKLQLESEAYRTNMTRELFSLKERLDTIVAEHAAIFTSSTEQKEPATLTV